MRFVLPLALMLAVMTFSSARQAQAVSLQGLVASGQSLSCGDKTFSEFGYTQTGDANVPASQVSVSCITANGNVGIEFAAAFHDDGGGAASDYLLKYTVTAPADKPIIDAHIFGNPESVGPGAAAIVTEAFAELPQNHLTIFHNASSSQTSDDTTFSALQQLTVTKDILLDGGADGTAALSHVDQTFSQRVPEPAAALLLASGLLGAYGWSRRRAV